MSMATESLRTIDSNVVLRYLLRDDTEQWERATRLIDSYKPLGLTAVALAEIAWTLAGPRYRRDHAMVATQLIDLLARENIVTVGFDKVEAQAALMARTSPTGAASFGDALIAACACSAGVQEIYSFDQRFARAGLTPVTPPYVRCTEHAPQRVSLKVLPSGHRVVGRCGRAAAGVTSVWAKSSPLNRSGSPIAFAIA